MRALAACALGVFAGGRAAARREEVKFGVHALFRFLAFWACLCHTQMLRCQSVSCGLAVCCLRCRRAWFTGGMLSCFEYILLKTCTITVFAINIGRLYNAILSKSDFGQKSLFIIQKYFTQIF